MTGTTKFTGNLEVTGTITADAIVADLQAETGSIGTAEIADDAVTLAKLATAVEPSHVVKYAGTLTTTAGSPSFVATVTGVATTDVVMATVAVSGGTPRGLMSAKATATNTITFTFSGDPSTDHQVAYTVFRATA